VVRHEPFVAVLADARLGVRELELRQVVPLDRRLEGGLEGVEPLQRLRRLGLLRAD
jgi:hypothetical protein